MSVALAAWRWFERRPVAADVALCLLVTAAAAALRLAMLGDIPYGVHPDEAQVGTDAHRILSEGWIGVYTHAALGQPTGHAYLTTPSIWALGDTAFALRLPLALVAVAAVPLLYAFARITLGRLEAAIAAALLAASYWHLVYSRVAHWSISYGTVVLASLLLIAIALRTRRAAWFAPAGALLGLGVYTYNVYPIALVAVAAFCALMALQLRRTPDFAWWLRGCALMLACAVIVALPFIVYLSDPDAYYWEHFDHYEGQRVTQTDAFRDEDPLGKMRILAEQAWTFARSYAWDADRDLIDATGMRPVFDPLTLVLLLAGAVIALRRWREPALLAALCCVAIIPLPAVPSTESIMRQPIAAAPFAMLLAALPLAAMVRSAARDRRAFAVALVVAALTMIAALTVRDYYWPWRDDTWVRFVYHQQITAASEYMRRLPEGTVVYLYSDRHPYRLETRAFLAPDVAGEDRSAEWSVYGGSIEYFDRSRPAAVVLLGAYTPLIEALRNRYPEGTERSHYTNGRLDFYAYELPPAADVRAQPIGPP